MNPIITEFDEDAEDFLPVDQTDQETALQTELDRLTDGISP